MKAILRQTVLLVLFAIALYPLLCMVCLLFSSEKSAYVDTFYYEETFHTLAFEAPRLQRTDKPKLIVLGASNGLLGFRPDQLQPYFPEFEVANLSPGGGNLTDNRQVLEMLQQILPQHVFKESYIVLGIYYGSFYYGGTGEIKNFRENKSVNDSLVKTALYRWKGDSIAPIVPAEKLDLLVQALRPVLLFEGYRKPAYLNPFRIVLPFGHSQSATGHDADNGDTDAIRAASGKCNRRGRKDPKSFHLKSRNLKMEKRQSSELIAICNLVQSNGGHLVLVDLPLPQYVQEQLEFHLAYQERKKDYLGQALRYPCVRYLNLLDNEELCDEDNFMDFTHPCPEAREFWSKALREEWDENGIGVR